MAKEATYGFMIWDAKSKGTLNNVLNLLRTEKKIVVYVVPTHAFQTVRTVDDLRTLLAVCTSQDLAVFEKELALSQFFQAVQAQLSFSLAENRVTGDEKVAVPALMQEIK